MNRRRLLAAVSLIFVMPMVATADEDRPKSTADVMAALSESDWRTPNDDDLLYIQLGDQIVLIELAVDFAPENIENIKTLVKNRYFDGTAIIRSQDNYVVQWADPDGDSDDAKPLGDAAETVLPEFQRTKQGIEISAVESRDPYADMVGFAAGFPVGSDGSNVWLTHCYGMVGVARSSAPDSGNGSSLYVITGHAPRHLDRNITVVGRVISGMELLSTLPRGDGPLGFYETADRHTPIASIRLGSEIDERQDIEILRTDSAAFSDYVKSRTFRHEDWFVDPTGRIEICNITPPVQIGN